MRTSPNDSKLKHSVLLPAVKAKRAGLSLVKLGQPKKIPESLSVACAIQSAMVEVAGEGEALPKKMKALTDGLNSKHQMAGYVQ
jgi:hypothetical protein